MIAATMRAKSTPGWAGAAGRVPAPSLSTACRRRAAWWALLTSLLLPGSALAGGGVMLENDTCIITVGFYRAHFTAYQPQTRGDEEFCEDLPDVGEAVFVLDYLHDSMKQVPVDFRIIRDATGLGNFTRLEDVRALGDLAPLTVFYRPPSVEPDASYRVRHEFAAPGHFVGIVTAGHPTKDKTYTAVFPFSVGLDRFPWLWVAAALGLVLGVAALAWFWLGAGRERPP